MDYVERVLEELKQKNPNEPEFHQAATEILNGLRPVVERHPEYEKAALLERFVEPERVILFRVPWVDDKGGVHVNKGYRVQFNSAIGAAARAAAISIPRARAITRSCASARAS